jgi:DNA mismatch repair protein MutL
VIKDIGIGVEEFGTNTFRVYSHPSWFKEGHEDESIRVIFDLISEEKGSFDRVKFNDRVAASIACKSSVKANTRIGYDEQVSIIENLFKCKFPYTCPHGRPTVIKYPLYELEKMFKRVNFSKVNNE